MIVYRALIALACSVISFAPVAAAEAPSGQPAPSEVKFIQSVQADLIHRFPTADDAQRAGYLRFTDEDETGSISYANRHWASDLRHPSQLWYDVHGKLLGADFSILKGTSPTPPHLWGINPKRWLPFRRPHVHYILKNPDGTLKYGLAVSGGKFAAAGGDVTKPDAATLLKMGAVKDDSAVQTVFEFPALWDLQVWVRPNPLGAFAEKNPNVTPSKDAGKGSM
ncbi:MAG: hypothetical protein DLM50_02425 [Candidatus Meridianibacter frigidus]|nr:MAG: hypothetical protein DLM50_02425 [Candidatus Eremiobacteraeota bacterium]